MEPSREGCLGVCEGIVPPPLLKIGDINAKSAVLQRFSLKDGRRTCSTGRANRSL